MLKSNIGMQQMVFEHAKHHYSNYDLMSKYLVSKLMANGAYNSFYFSHSGEENIIDSSTVNNSQYRILIINSKHLYCNLNITVWVSTTSILVDC